MVAMVAMVVALIATGCSFGSEPRPIPSLPPTTLPPEQPPPPATAPADPTGGVEDQTDPAVPLEVGDDFQTMVEASPAGTVFLVKSGLHRLQEVRPKSGMTFEGEPGAILSGAIELTDWTTRDSRSWAIEGIPKTGENDGECIDGYSGCSYSQDLFMDDVMLWQVTDIGDLASGTWYWGGDSIIVADDPTSRRVELSVAMHAFAGVADDVTIRGVTVEKYAAPAQTGAIQASAPGNFSPLSSRWLIEDVELRLNHGAGVRLGNTTTVRRAHIHHNGQLGLVANEGVGSIVEDSEVSHNNIAGFRWGWEAGGSKFKRTKDLIVRRNHVHHNNGPGLWTDIDNYNTLYDSNVVTDNVGPGIFHEISYSAVIRNNTVTDNSVDSHRWLWGSGILVAVSADVEVHDNIVSGNGNGIGGVQQDRGDGPEGKRLLVNLHVHGNTVALGGGGVGVVEDTGDRAVFSPERGNRFEDNIYTEASGLRYHWNGRSLDRQRWQAAGQDINGTWQHSPQPTQR